MLLETSAQWVCAAHAYNEIPQTGRPCIRFNSKGDRLAPLTKGVKGREGSSPCFIVPWEILCEAFQAYHKTKTIILRILSQLKMSLNMQGSGWVLETMGHMT